MRTSLVFWQLTSIALLNPSNANGKEIPCNITPDNCNSAFREFNACSLNLTGINVRINGRLTRCLNKTAFHAITQPDCDGRYIRCRWGDPCYEVCPSHANRKCLGSLCGACFNLAVDTEHCFLECPQDERDSPCQ